MKKNKDELIKFYDKKGISELIEEALVDDEIKKLISIEGDKMIVGPWTKKNEETDGSRETFFSLWDNYLRDIGKI